MPEFLKPLSPTELQQREGKGKYYVITDLRGYDRYLHFIVEKDVRSTLKGHGKMSEETHTKLVHGRVVSELIYAYSTPTTLPGHIRGFRNYGIFEVEGIPTDGFNDEYPDMGSFKKVKVVRELHTWDLFGRNGQAVDILIEFWGAATTDEIYKLAEAQESFPKDLIYIIKAAGYDPQRCSGIESAKRFIYDVMRRNHYLDYRKSNLDIIKCSKAAEFVVNCASSLQTEDLIPEDYLRTMKVFMRAMGLNRLLLIATGTKNWKDTY